MAKASTAAIEFRTPLSSIPEKKAVPKRCPMKKNAITNRTSIISTGIISSDRLSDNKRKEARYGPGMAFTP